MIYALVKNNIIQNVIVAEAPFIDLIQPDYDEIVQLDDKPGDPGIGWSSATGEFVPPEPAPIPQEEQQNLDAEFGSSLVKKLSAFSDESTLTPDEKSKSIQILSPLNSLLQIGDLKSALEIIPTIPVDGVLITQGMMDSFYKEIVVYLDTK